MIKLFFVLVKIDTKNFENIFAPSREGKSEL
jgi:hypothetical protein